MTKKRTFDEFFKEFEEVDGIFERLFEGLKREELKDVSGPVYYGFSMHIGPEHFENISPGLSGEVNSETWEPFSDIILDEKTNELVLTLEMPGIEKKDIRLEAAEKTVEVKAETESRSYYKKIPLEQEINPDTVSASYNNGVLEIKAKLKEPVKKEGKKIMVE